MKVRRDIYPHRIDKASFETNDVALRRVLMWATVLEVKVYRMSRTKWLFQGGPSRIKLLTEHPDELTSLDLNPHRA